MTNGTAVFVYTLIVIWLLSCFVAYLIRITERPRQ